MTPARTLCTDCGISRTDDPKRCAHACQFIQPDYERLERQVHGRPRDPARMDEQFFGPFKRMLRASMVQPRAGAQWTGITTRMAERLLETGAVTAVLTMAPDSNDAWRPVPVLVTEAAGMAACRGMRMGYAPLLSLLEPALAQGHTRLAVIAIPCQVYALRALEKELGFEQLHVIGTPCSDNTTTERFHEFLELVAQQVGTEADAITYLEFRADYHVELRFKDGRVKTIPFLQLPISRLPPDFFRSPAALAWTTPTCCPTSRWDTWVGKVNSGCWCATNAVKRCWNCWALRCAPRHRAAPASGRARSPAFSTTCGAPPAACRCGACRNGCAPSSVG